MEYLLDDRSETRRAVQLNTGQALAVRLQDSSDALHLLSIVRHRRGSKKRKHGKARGS